MKHIEIYNIVSKYYPIGLDRKKANDQSFNDYKHLHRKIKKMFNSKEDLNKWKTIADEIGTEFKELLNIVIASNPFFDTCYSLELFIKTRTIENITITKKMYCHHSFLSDFFCIYGKDEVSISNSEDFILFDPIITVSPTNDYEKYFLNIHGKMQQKYPNSKFLPFVSLSNRIDNLIINTSILKKNQYSSVFQALFTRENLTDFTTYGDIFYE